MDCFKSEPGFLVLGVGLIVGALDFVSRDLPSRATPRVEPLPPSSLRKNLETEPLSSQMRVEFWRWIEHWPDGGCGRSHRARFGV